MSDWIDYLILAAVFVFMFVNDIEAMFSWPVYKIRSWLRL